MNDVNNGQKLRALIESAGMTQLGALNVFNKRQARPLSVSQWKAWPHQKVPAAHLALMAY